MSLPVVLITGTSSGIGFATALAAAEAGCTVVATMRDLAKANPLREAAASRGVTIHIDQLNVQDPESITACVARTLETHGRIDTLVANAGFGVARFLELATEAQMQEAFDVNTFGVMRCIQAVLPTMRAQSHGHLIAVSSVGGLVGQPMNEIYCAAKFAVEGLMESMATYLEPYFGIRCSLIEPAATRSEFVNRVLGDLTLSGGLPEGPYSETAQDYLKSVQSEEGFLTRSQSPEEVAEVIVATLLNPAPPLRVPTSQAARLFCQEKLAVDPDGGIQTARIRAQFLKR